ncbi:MAG TPA: TonB-dependent receptor [Roseateles sp.]
MRQTFKRTTLSLAAVQALAWMAVPAMAQNAPAAPAADKPQSLETVVVSGRRAAIASAQKIKQDSDEIVDSIVADDIGKLPDRSVTEVLQRIVGVTMDRTAARSDPVHYSVEGSGVVIRGLTYVAAQLNGRETFSANQGRNLGFEDVPPELMAGVDVYKNPSAEQIEGAIAGLVNLRTALPLDFNGFKAAVSLGGTYGTLNKKKSPEASFLVSNTWNTDLGRFGALIDVAHSKGSSRTDTVTVDPYYRTTTFWKTVNSVNYYNPTPDNHWFPRDLTWRTQSYDRTRDGVYAALQWKKDKLDSSLTYFRSEYRFDMDELAIKAEVNPYEIAVSDGTWNDNGMLVKGVLKSTSGTGGFEIENQGRLSTRKSKTEDLSWNFRWKPTDQWTLTSDVQYVRSNTKAFDSTVATGLILPKQIIDMTGKMPSLTFDAADQAFIADRNNYYWATTMEHLDRGKGSQKAVKLDARYQFNDHPVLQDLRFGVRFTDRDATTENSNPSYNWAAVSKAWERGWYFNNTDLAWVKNGSNPTTYRSFDNFMGGSAVPMPAMHFPANSVILGFPESYQSLHDQVKPLCEDRCGWQGPTVNPYTWAPAAFGDPSGLNKQKERTTSVYSQLRFGFDEWATPVDGNVGVRVVRTKSDADGFTVLTVSNVPTSVTTQKSFSTPIQASNSYTDVLPSLNLKAKLRDDLQMRFAWAKAISRPSFGDMQAYSNMTLSADIDAGTGAVKAIRASGSANGNPDLRPVKANQQDVTAEWYFSKTGSLTFAAFNKELKDVILDQTFSRNLRTDDGKDFSFVLTGKTNAAKGHARGVELAYRQFYDQLPGWLSGFGIEANYTYVDSKMHRYDAVPAVFCTAGAGQDNLNLFVNGCDTDGRSFGDMPLPQLSRNTMNLALLFDRGPFSARLAYSWRQRYLQGVSLNSDNTGPNQQNVLDTNPNSATYGASNLPLGLPLWGDSYGQLDAGVHYKFGDNMTVSVEALNLTNATNRQLMQQHIATSVHNYFTSGRQYKLGMRYTF